MSNELGGRSREGEARAKPGNQLVNNMSARAYAVMPHATPPQGLCGHAPSDHCHGCKSSSCSKIRHVIATFIYAIITLSKHRFESHKYVNMLA